jgi:hypothetical protein
MRSPSAARASSSSLSRSRGRCGPSSGLGGLPAQRRKEVPVLVVLVLHAGGAEVAQDEARRLARFGIAAVLRHVSHEASMRAWLISRSANST